MPEVKVEGGPAMNEEPYQVQTSTSFAMPQVDPPTAHGLHPLNTSSSGLRRGSILFQYAAESAAGQNTGLIERLSTASGSTSTPWTGLSTATQTVEALRLADYTYYFTFIHPSFPVINSADFLARLQWKEGQWPLPDYILTALALATAVQMGTPFAEYSAADLSRYLFRQLREVPVSEKVSNPFYPPAQLLAQLYFCRPERISAFRDWSCVSEAVYLGLQQYRAWVAGSSDFNLTERTPTDITSIASWSCYFAMDTWYSIRRGRPPVTPSSTPRQLLDLTDKIEGSSSNDYAKFSQLLSLTHIVADIQSQIYDSKHPPCSTRSNADRDVTLVQSLRIQLAAWRNQVGSFRDEMLEIAYHTAIILLHRPLLPANLLIHFDDPILLLVTRCAIEISRSISALKAKSSTETSVYRHSWWHLFISIGLLTAGMSLIQNGALPPSGPTNAIRHISIQGLAAIFAAYDHEECEGESGAYKMLKSVAETCNVTFSESDKLLSVESTLVEPGSLPMPHEDPAFSMDIYMKNRVQAYIPAVTSAPTFHEQHHMQPHLYNSIHVASPSPRVALNNSRMLHQQQSSKLEILEPPRPGSPSSHSMHSYSSHSTRSSNQSLGGVPSLLAAPIAILPRSNLEDYSLTHATYPPQPLSEYDQASQFPISPRNPQPHPFHSPYPDDSRHHQQHFAVPLSVQSTSVPSLPPHLRPAPPNAQQQPLVAAQPTRLRHQLPYNVAPQQQQEQANHPPRPYPINQSTSSSVLNPPPDHHEYYT